MQSREVNPQQFGELQEVDALLWYFLILTDDASSLCELAFGLQFIYHYSPDQYEKP